MAKTLIIDARGLNYLKQTGVNIYTLQCLKIILQLVADSDKDNRPAVTLMGIKTELIDVLEKRYPWLKPYLGNSIMTLEEYLGIPTFLRRFLSNKSVSFLLEVSLFVLPRKLFDAVWFRTTSADSVWQPSHKALPVNKKSNYYITIHDIFSILHPQNLSFIQKIRDSRNNLAKSASVAVKVITPSYSTARDTAKQLKVDPDKIQVVHSGPIDESLLFNELSTSENESKFLPEQNESYFLCVSGIEPRKNWYNIILAHYYNTLHQAQEYTASLYLLGIPVDYRYYIDLQNLVKDSHIPRVYFVENARNELKHRYIKNSICLIYASLYEGFGFPILEALAQGKSLITSQISSMPEIAQNAALYVNPLDIVDIANSMMIMNTDEKFRQTLEINTAALLNQFSWNENYLFWHKLLR